MNEKLAGIKREVPGSQFRDEFGRDVDRKTPSNKFVTLLELMGTETNGSPYFQSSALPTELPGQGVRKRVLNRPARSESSPRRRFRAPAPIIPGSRRVGFVGGDAKFIGSGPCGMCAAGAEEFEVGGGWRPRLCGEFN